MTALNAPRHTGPLVHLEPPRTWGELFTVMKIATGASYDFFIRFMVAEVINDFREQEARIFHLLSHPIAQNRADDLPTEVVMMVKHYLRQLLLYPQRGEPCALRDFLHQRAEGTLKE